MAAPGIQISKHGAETFGSHAGAANLFNFGRRKFAAQRYREKLSDCPETVLASVRRQFIFVHSLTRTRSSPCHEVFSSVLADLALCLWTGDCVCGQAMTLTDPPQRPQTSMSILKTRLRRCTPAAARRRSGRRLNYPESAAWDRCRLRVRVPARRSRPPAGATARAETPFLAGKRHQLLEVAGVAAHPQESMFEAAAPEIRFEFSVDMVGQRFTLLGQLVD
ncbi:MAG: hypothetical protein ACI87W_000940 [Halieaceae bacterium]